MSAKAKNLAENVPRRKDESVAIAFNSSFMGYAAHAGALLAFLEIGVKPDVVAGASAGALVAGLYAAGVSENKLKKICSRPLPMRHLLDLRALPSCIGMLGHFYGSGLLCPKKMRKLLAEELGNMRIEDCPTARLETQVTNMSEAKTEIICRGNLADFLTASISYPGVFRPMKISGKYYWDGGIANCAPFHQWLENPEIKHIIIHLNHQDERANKHKKNFRENKIFWNSLGIAHYAIIEHNLELQIKLAKQSGKALLIIHSHNKRPNPFFKKNLCESLEKSRKKVLASSKIIQNFLSDGTNVKSVHI